MIILRLRAIPGGADFWRGATAVLTALGLVALPGTEPAEGQVYGSLHGPDSPPEVPEEWGAPRWVGDVSFAATNTLLAGVTAGIVRRLRGGEFGEGFASGAAGGALAYAGRRVGAADFDGAGLLGRQISAVGVSMARNAADGRPALERLMFPLGPLHLHVDRAPRLRLQPKLHVVGLGQAVRLALSPETRFDAAASLSAGAPVFRAPGRGLLVEGVRASGLALHGSIVLGEAEDPDQLFAHERVHIIQSDFAFLAWNDPAEGWLLDRSRYTATAYRYLDFGALLPTLAIVVMRLTDVDFQEWPHELEASFLADR